MSKYRLTDGYKITGFKTMQKILPHESITNARVIKLKRTNKKLYAKPVVSFTKPIMIKGSNLSGTFHVVIWKYI
jgi:hypothetical protein